MKRHAPTSLERLLEYQTPIERGTATGHSIPAERTTAVVIPARNEAATIGACLDALSRQCGEARALTFVVLVANNCTDGTAEAASAAARDKGLASIVLDIEFRGDGNVGLARKIGVAAALSAQPFLNRILTTDADCRVNADWLEASFRHLAEVDAVCGKIIPNPDETSEFPTFMKASGALEYTYSQASLEFAHLINLGPPIPWPHHGQAGGASLGFRREAYEICGGFRSTVCGEDRDIVRRMKMSGQTVIHADDVRVMASCRLIGRAPGGMADRLVERTTDPQAYTDECLVPVPALLAKAPEVARAGLFRDPEKPVPAQTRLRPAELPAQIEHLSEINTILRETRPEQRLDVVKTLLDRHLQADTDLPDAFNRTLYRDHPGFMRT
ncbi:glycosyltransferase family 2 protein [Notoacmeibacter sp. MSK16QG-6]|uniref:glycosyltransferase n=1 Tax=Notoacmeibacter sp. MSK16QG-6 TaxID=2957982 RepID=UPI0020A19CB5|nr:glycosyltransferase [Notoacmeibacter sp. MSK16QG-6]MCP1200857.1 glycosyltransferase [Notoacmeibacter sp. MSK16QG-6]